MDTCLFRQVIRKYSDSFTGRLEAGKEVRKMIKPFPDVPDFDLIVSLSGQKYEGKNCTASIVFLSADYENENLELSVQYEYPIEFISDNLRFIRKLLEPVDCDSCMVMLFTEEQYKAVGIIKKQKIERLLALQIEIMGHVHWRARIRDLLLFQYQSGDYHCFYHGEYNEETFKGKLSDVFGGTISSVSVDAFCRIMKILSILPYGTSFAIIGDADAYSDEIRRLTHSCSGHGIKLKETISFNDECDEELKHKLWALTNLDGGLIFDVNANCDAFACVFNGLLKEEYNKGDSARGSRFNSMALYIDFLKEKSVPAVGVVLSDDRTVDYITV